MTQIEAARIIYKQNGCCCCAEGEHIFCDDCPAKPIAKHMNVSCTTFSTKQWFYNWLILHDPIFFKENTMTKDRINSIRENLKNITDEQIEKIAEIIAPVIAPDPDQEIIDAWKIFEKRQIFFDEELNFSVKLGDKYNRIPRFFYAGWKACENYLKNKNAS